MFIKLTLCQQRYHFNTKNLILSASISVKKLETHIIGAPVKFYTTHLQKDPPSSPLCKITRKGNIIHLGDSFLRGGGLPFFDNRSSEIFLSHTVFWFDGEGNQFLGFVFLLQPLSQLFKGYLSEGGDTMSELSSWLNKQG